MFGAGRLARGFTDIIVGSQRGGLPSHRRCVCSSSPPAWSRWFGSERQRCGLPCAWQRFLFTHIVCALRNLISVAVAVNPVSNISCGQMIDSLLLPFMSFSFYACPGSHRKQVVGGCGSPFTSWSKPGRRPALGLKFIVSSKN